MRARLPFTRSSETPTQQHEGPGFSVQGKVLLWTLPSRAVQEDSGNCLESIGFSVLIGRNMEGWVIEGAGSLPLLYSIMKLASFCMTSKVAIHDAE